MSICFGVIRFPGSNCDDDALHIVNTVLADKGCSGKMLWHKDTDLGQVDALIVPGGFSYGDYLRAGSMAAHAPIMDAVKEFALKMPIAHSEGRYVHPDIERLEGEAQVVFRYCNAEGTVGSEANPNGSVNDIAGICNAAGNVVGLMPHPERACEPLLGGGGSDGLSLFTSALEFLQNGSGGTGASA
jgi:phosphoribosylformylglycinamidine synthase